MFDFLFKKHKEPATLYFHTDIHCHLVPGIDDGQREAARAATLVAREKLWGIDRIICTPHITQDTFENTPETIVPAFNALKSEVEKAGIDIHLDYSAEHRIDSFFTSQLQAGNIRTLPDGFILVENSFMQEPWDLDNFLFDLRLKGFKPILAHPERYSYYYDKKQRYIELHRVGTYFQVNLLSLAGHYGKAENQIAEFLIKHDMVDFIGTDMHSSSHADTIERYIGSKDFRRHAEQLEDRLLNDRLSTRNPSEG